MIVTVTGKHIDITDAIRSHIEQKAAKMPRYLDAVSQIEVIIEGASGVIQSVEVIASVEHRDDVVARETGTDMYACIDQAMHKLERQLHKIKGKQRDNKHGAPPERDRMAELGVIDEESL